MGSIILLFIIFRATPYKRAQPYSDDQKRALIEYMRRNPDLRHSKSCSPFARNKWMEITNDLNKMYGTKKDFKEWRKVNTYLVILNFKYCFYMT